MRKTTLYTCLALASSVLVLGTAVNAAPLSTTPANAARPTLLDLLRHGTDDNLANGHHGRGRDHSPNHASNDDRGSASSRGHGADDGAGHEHHGGSHGGGNDDGPGDDHGGRR